MNVLPEETVNDSPESKETSKLYMSGRRLDGDVHVIVVDEWNTAGLVELPPNLHNAFVVEKKFDPVTVIVVIPDSGPDFGETATRSGRELVGEEEAAEVASVSSSLLEASRYSKTIAPALSWAK